MVLSRYISPSFNCSPQIFAIFDDLGYCGAIMTGSTLIRQMWPGNLNIYPRQHNVIYSTW